MAASGSGTSGTASDEGRTAEHIAWEQSVKDAAANGGHKPDERGEYRCRCASTVTSYTSIRLEACHEGHTR